MTALLKGVARQRESEFGTAVEDSAVGDSDSNASMERAIQDVEGQTGTLRAGLERKIGRRILGDEFTPCVVGHATCLITWCRVRSNGRTSLEMMKGRRTNSRFA